MPIGRLSEICGRPSSGRTSLGLGLLATTLARGVLVGWVDLADALDPASALEAILALGGESEDLERLLWVRARSDEEAVRSCERLLETEGFELVVLDAGLDVPVATHASGATTRPTRSTASAVCSIKDVTWLRLARLAAGTRTALVVLAPTAMAGSRSELVLELESRGTRFATPPPLLEAIETRAVLRRHRSRPAGASLALSLDRD